MFVGGFEPYSRVSAFCLFAYCNRIDSEEHRRWGRRISVVGMCTGRKKRNDREPDDNARMTAREAEGVG